jgi:hypothetical protein
LRTPSISRRRSKWCLDAQCSWTTNIGKNVILESKGA